MPPHTLINISQAENLTYIYFTEFNCNLASTPHTLNSIFYSRKVALPLYNKLSFQIVATYLQTIISSRD